MKVVLLWLVLPLVPLATWLGVRSELGPTPAPSIAYVSAQRIATETTEGKAGVARVKTAQQQHAADVRAKQGAYEAARKALAAATAATRDQLQAAEREQRVELERAVGRAQADMQEVQRDVNNELLKRVRGVVGDVVKDRGIQVVLNYESAVVWAGPTLDISDAVIARMNAAPAPAPAAR